MKLLPLITVFLTILAIPVTADIERLKPFMDCLDSLGLGDDVDSCDHLKSGASVDSSSGRKSETTKNTRLQPFMDCLDSLELGDDLDSCDHLKSATRADSSSSRKSTTTKGNRRSASSSRGSNAYWLVCQGELTYPRVGWVDMGKSNVRERLKTGHTVTVYMNEMRSKFEGSIEMPKFLDTYAAGDLSRYETWKLVDVKKSADTLTARIEFDNVDSVLTDLLLDAILDTSTDYRDGKVEISRMTGQIKVSTWNPENNSFGGHSNMKYLGKCEKSDTAPRALF